MKIKYKKRFKENDNIEYCYEIYDILYFSIEKKLLKNINENVGKIITDINEFLQTPKKYNNRFIINVNYGLNGSKYIKNSKKQKTDRYFKVLIFNLQCHWNINNEFSSIKINEELFWMCEYGISSILNDYERINKDNIDIIEELLYLPNGWLIDWNDYISLDCNSKLTLKESKTEELKEKLNELIFQQLLIN